ncbi:MAG: S8 family serine peptidase, partial [Candidatus Zixiibacteriota bacterium]
MAASKPVHTSISASAQVDYVVIKFYDQHKVRLAGSVFNSKSGAQMSAVNAVAESIPAGRIRRLFHSNSVESLDRKRQVLISKSKKELADMNGYYRIEVSSVAEAARLIDELNSLEIVEIAYFQPKPSPAGFFEESTVPNYQSAQDYREAAPVGVDADYANGFAGGDGAGVMIIDIEGAWRHSHVDLSAAAGSHIAGTQIADLSWRNHGTAVLGEMIANDDGQGVVGICPGADVGTVSIGSLSTEEALMIAAENLQPGDAILIELHAPGPHYNFESRPDQLGYVCMEYWQATFDAIQYCWASGLVVIEAAGNGAENFDNSLYYQDLFDTTYRNSHAIIAGAGHPPVDGASNLQRESFSNYGERVNLQGYGSDVYSTGYGGLYSGGGLEDSFYTASFSGTSSASPIITGSAVCLQGRYKAIYGVPMTVDQIRSILVATGTPQQGNLNQH